MTLTQIRSFLAIAREQNLTRAAENLNLSQSAISSQLKSLEDELGVRLFERNARGMSLSEAGRILSSYAKDVLASCRTLQRCAESLSRGISSVRIGLNANPNYLRVSAINQRLSLLHPDLNVIFHASETVRTAQLLSNETIDIGFYYGDLNNPNISEQQIATVRVCVAIPTKLYTGAKELNWDALCQLPWVWVDDKFPFYQALSKKIGPLNTSPQQIVTAANEHIVHELVVTGQGIAFMREDEARPLASEGRIKIWEKGWCDISLNIGWLKERGSNRQIKKVREAISHIWISQNESYGEWFADQSWA